MSKILIVIGFIFLLAGILLHYQIFPSWLGRLPGDISIKGDNYSFYFPLMTSLILSIILSILLYLFQK